MYQLSCALEGHSQDVRDVVAISDEKVASVSRDGSVRVWSKLEGQRTWESKIIHESEGFLNSITYESERNLLFYGGKDTLINASPADASLGDDPCTR